VVSAVNLFAAFAGLAAALLALWLARAPGWRELGPAALVSGAGGALGLTTVALTEGQAMELAPLLGQLRLAFGAAGVAAWLVYTGRDLGAPRSRLQRFAVASAVLAGLIALVPGWTFGPPVIARAVPALGVVYQDPKPTAVGAAAEAWLLLLLGVIAARYAVAAVRRRDAAAGLQAGAFAALLAAAVNDVLAIGGLLPTPYLLGPAALLPVAIATVRLARRFAVEAAALAELRRGLERLAERRARQLEEADEELEAAARLARLGRAAGALGRSLAGPSTEGARAIDRALEEIAKGDREAAQVSLEDALSAARRLAEVARRPFFTAPAGRV
jgi:hypothetical protein